MNRDYDLSHIISNGSSACFAISYGYVVVWSCACSGGGGVAVGVGFFSIVFVGVGFDCVGGIVFSFVGAG